MKKSINLILFLLVLIGAFGCVKEHIIGNAGKKDCIYQRFKFIGSSKVKLEKGVEILDSLSVALTLEKNAILKSGNASNDLKIKVNNMLTEVGEFEIPISKEEATNYTKLANSICTLRDDLYSEKNIFPTDELKERAVNTYLDLLSAVEGLKKNLSPS